jgi:hypothetical protein
VHDLAGATAALRAARAAGREVVLRSPPGAIHVLGLGYLVALFALARRRVPGARFGAVLDCDDDAARAHRALALGVATVAFRGHSQARRRLEAVAAALGARLVRGGIPRSACVLDDAETGAALARHRLGLPARRALPRRRGKVS